ncbi:MAG TPA: DoxX-like family protein [Bacteroidia bacterium]|nr:DoxX-like family protein [Bacteroidia bacterium]
MNSYRRTNQILTILISLVWLVNGLVCKMLNLVPRHRAIVGRILGMQHAVLFTFTIGIAEVLMSIWIISGILARLNAITQMLVIATMNIIEFILAPDLLLWGRWNAFFAFLFILLIGYNEFVLRKRPIKN